MHISLALANTQATALITALNGGSAITYSGAMPATPETTATGTVLATNALPATFGTTSNGVVTVAAITAVAATGTGIPGYIRLLSSGAAAQIDLQVAPAWGASLAVAVGTYCVNGSNYYKCLTAGTTASTGGPTGTAVSGITDGTAVWGYVGATATAAGVDVTTTATQITAGSTWTLSPATITLPGV